jgi:ABC-type amino acid transport substrate-binding protein
LKRNPGILAALLFVSILASGCSGQRLPTATPEANSPLTRARIGVHADLAPYETYDTVKQEVSGFDIELMKTIGERANIYVEFVRINAGYNPLINQISQCRLDGGISAITATDEAKQEMDFSEPYYTTGQVLVVKKGNIKITGLDSLSGMIVGTQANTPSAIELEKIKGIKPKLFESFYFAFQELIAGNIDAVIADHPRAWKYVQVKPNNLKIVGEEFANVSYAIAFCKSRPEILQQINTELAGMKKDGTLDKLIKKWQLTSYGE